MCTWLTLWAGSVFNAHPRCESREGESGITIPWCDFLSVAIGVADVCAGVIAMLYFLHLKGVCTCLGQCFGKLQVVRHSFRFRKMAAARRQRPDIADAADTDGNESDVQEVKLQVIELKPINARDTTDAQVAGQEGIHLTAASSILI